MSCQLRLETMNKTSTCSALYSLWLHSILRLNFSIWEGKGENQQAGTEFSEDDFPFTAVAALARNATDSVFLSAFLSTQDTAVNVQQPTRDQRLVPESHCCGQVGIHALEVGEDRTQK